jgi:hypothetical protein
MASPRSEAVATRPTFRRTSSRVRARTQTRYLFSRCPRWGPDPGCTWSIDGTSGRSVGRPSKRHLVDGHRTACRPPLHPADGMADSHPTASRLLRPSVGWRTAAPSAGRGGGRPAGRTPPPGPSTRGSRQKPSAKVRPPSQNFGGP